MKRILGKWGLVCEQWSKAEERGAEQPGQREGTLGGQQTGRSLGCEPCTGCWPRSRPMAERVVDGTLVDMSLDWRATFTVPALLHPQVARFCSREIAGFSFAGRWCL